MDLTTENYTIKTGDTYYSIAEYLLSKTEGYDKDGFNAYIIKSIENGLMLHLRFKKLNPGENIVIVKDVNYYLNLSKTSTKSYRDQRNEQTYDEKLNLLKKVGSHLFFDIRIYNDYKDYAWEEKTPGSEHTEGEIGLGLIGANGCKVQSKLAENGYVYIFDRDGNLKFIYRIKEGKYREVKLRNSESKQNNDSELQIEVSNPDCPNYEEIGPEFPCCILWNYFKNDVFGSANEYFYIKYSTVPLSKQRLLGPEEGNIPPIDGTNCSYSSIADKYTLGSLIRDDRPGVKILYEFRKEKSFTLSNYYLQPKSFQNYGAGISMHFPDPIAEMVRRAKIFQERYEAMDKWVNTESFQQQKFLHTLVSAMVKKDSSMSSRVDLERLNLWEREYDKRLNDFNLKIWYAIRSLLDWMETDMLKEALLNMISTDNRQYWADAIQAYDYALTYLDQHSWGRYYYDNVVNDSTSFLSIVLGLGRDVEHTLGTNNEPHASLLLKDYLFNQDELATRSAYLRKGEQATLSLIKTAAPTIAKFLKAKTGLKAMSDLLTLLSKGNVNLTTQIVKPLAKLNLTISAIDTKFLSERISSLVGGKKAAGVIATFEAVNIIFSVKTLVDDKENRGRNIAALTGAVMDFFAGVGENKVATSWLFQRVSLLKKISQTAFGAKAVPGMQLISGALDCYVGIDSAMEAYRHGEIGLVTGYSFFAAGGAICAFGAGLIIAGGETATLSLGSASIPAAFVILGGVVIEGVGSVIVHIYDNKSTKDWLKACIFGKDFVIGDYVAENEIGQNNKLAVVDILLIDNAEMQNDISKVTKTQINKINEILCAYTVDASFEQSERKFYNSTQVTIEIEPTIITDQAIIHLTEMHAIAQARLSEMINPFSNRHDLVSGMAGCGDKFVVLQDIIDKPDQVEKDSNGIIKKIKIPLYFDMDIDKIKGKVTIDFNSGTMQQLEKDFDVEAAFYE